MKWLQTARGYIAITTAEFLPRFVWTLLLLVLLITVGTLGYMIIERQTFSDSIYMTAITLTAVGYEEVWHLSRVGRVFTMVLLLGGLTFLGVWFANLTSFVVELDLANALQKRRNAQDIKNMKDHVIICGAGRTGRQVARELEASNMPYVIIERDKQRIEQLSEYVNKPHVLEADATHDHALLEAGLQKATGLIACLSADADNLYLCLSARDLAADLTIVARAYEEESIDKLYRAGATKVISPNTSSARRMASVLLRPSVVSFLDIVTRSSGLALRLEQTRVADSSAVVGKSLGDSRIPEVTGLILIAIRQGSELESDFAFNPAASTILRGGDTVITLGDPDQLTKLRAYLG